MPKFRCEGSYTVYYDSVEIEAQDAVEAENIYLQRVGEVILEKFLVMVGGMKTWK